MPGHDASTTDGRMADLDAGPAESGPDEGPEAAPGRPAQHATFPQVLSLGGAVLSAPQIVPVFFANDSEQVSIEQFLAQLATSSYWTATTSEYGVGALRVAPSIVVSDAPPASSTDAETVAWLASYLDGTHTEWPAIDPNNVYVVFYPQTTAFTDNRGQASCSAIGGYHREGFLTAGAGDGGVGAGDAEATAEAGEIGEAGGTGDVGATGDGGSIAMGPSFIYAVIGRCSALTPGLTGVDSLTAILSHELVEAATDPRVVTDPAYALVDFDHLAWGLNFAGTLAGSEVGDMCQLESPERSYQRLVGTFVVQRTWSNRAAAADEDPCVPSAPDVYFNAAPDFDELVDVYLSSSAEQRKAFYITTGLRVPVGQSKTINLRLFSTGFTPAWNVNVFRATTTQNLRIQWSKSTGNDGDLIQITFTRTSAAPLGGNVVRFVASAAPLTTLSSPTAVYNSWAGFIAN